MKNSKERRSSASIMKSLLAASIIMMSAVSMSACGDSTPASVTGLSDSPADEVVSYEPDTGGIPIDQKGCEESGEEPSEDEYNNEDNYDFTDNSDNYDYTDNSDDYDDNDSCEAEEPEPAYEYDSGTDCSGETVCYESVPAEESQASAPEEAAAPPIDQSHDYSAEADVRTNIVEIRAAEPSVGATDAVIKADVLNRSDGSITMVGCTLYSDMGEPVAATYQECSNDEPEFSLEYSIGSDLGIVLERGRTYYYRFAVMKDGELFTHDRKDFKTISVDDTFAFELQPAEISETVATVSATVHNPTNARAMIVGCKLYTPQGALMNEQEYGIDTTDTDFTVSFDFTNDGEKLPEASDYEYQIYLKYNGEKYTSNYGSFTTLP